jgi:hypothetical protein
LNLVVTQWRYYFRRLPYTQRVVPWQEDEGLLLECLNRLRSISGLFLPEANGGVGGGANRRQPPRDLPRVLGRAQNWILLTGQILAFTTCNAEPAADIQPSLDRSQVVAPKELAERIRYWNLVAFLCQVAASPQAESLLQFPSSYFPRVSDARQNCNDNDMTLFNGLLCASGDKRGCKAVRDSQDSDTGEWFRNPQYLIENISDPGGGSQFSPDMALGVQLYVLATKDIARFHHWLEWLQSINAPPPNCGDFGLIPVLSPNDCRTRMRPGDASTLAVTVDYLSTNDQLPILPKGRLHSYLTFFKSFNRTIVASISLRLSSAGYPMHLAASTLLIYRLTGNHDYDFAAKMLVDRKENRGGGTFPAPPGSLGNAFFDYLQFGPSSLVYSDILASCPSQNTDKHDAPDWGTTWHWQNAVKDRDWTAIDYWDCLFAANLYLSGPR